MTCRNRNILLFVLIFSISTRSGFTFQTGEIAVAKDTLAAVELTLPELHDGDIILRKGKSLVSDLIARNFAQCENMSHCGIILRNGRDAYVVHTISGAISADDGIRCEPLAAFINSADQHKVLILRSQNHLEAKRIRDECTRLLQAKVGFDHEFDANDSTALYCSELVRNVYLASGLQDRFHYSSRYGIQYIDFGSFFDTKLFSRIYQTYK